MSGLYPISPIPLPPACLIDPALGARAQYLKSQPLASLVLSWTVQNRKSAAIPEHSGSW